MYTKFKSKHERAISLRQKVLYLTVGNIARSPETRQVTAHAQVDDEPWPDEQAHRAYGLPSRRLRWRGYYARNPFQCRGGRRPRDREQRASAKSLSHLSRMVTRAARTRVDSCEVWAVFVEAQARNARLVWLHFVLSRFYKVQQGSPTQPY